MNVCVRIAKSTNRTVQQANVRTASRVAIRASNTSPGVLWRFFLNGGTRTTGGTRKVNWWQAKNLGIIFLVFEIKNVNFTTNVFLIVLQYLYSVYQDTILFHCSNTNTGSPLSSNGME